MGGSNGTSAGDMRIPYVCGSVACAVRIETSLGGVHGRVRGGAGQMPRRVVCHNREAAARCKGGKNIAAAQKSLKVRNIAQKRSTFIAAQC